LLLLLVLMSVLLQAQARDAAMQVQAAMLTAQNIHLRRELASGWAAADSNLIQVKHSRRWLPCLGASLPCLAVRMQLSVVAGTDAGACAGAPCWGWRMCCFLRVCWCWR
jgi:hypothetical protein